ncbi:hypothetical protein VPH35_075190 [Triticum aestivum]
MALLLFVILSFVSAPISTTLATPQHTCKFELASLAAVSCQDSVQSPTASCCDALIYAVDLEPSFELDRGACCLCQFMLVRDIPFDLPSLYRSCHGKDSDMVVAWPTYMKECNGVCHEDGADVHAPVPPAPFALEPPAPFPKRTETKKSLDKRIIVAIIAGSLVIVMLLCCAYYKCPRGKAHQSPATSDDDLSGGAGVQMRETGRNSSSRNLLPVRYNLAAPS